MKDPIVLCLSNLAIKMASADPNSGSETLRIFENHGRGFLGNLSPVLQRYPYRDWALSENDFNRRLWWRSGEYSQQSYE